MNLNKGNFVGMRAKLAMVDWETMIKGMTVNGKVTIAPDDNRLLDQIKENGRETKTLWPIQKTSQTKWRIERQV